MKIKYSLWLFVLSLVCFAWVIARVYERHAPISRPKNQPVNFSLQLPAQGLILPIIPGSLSKGVWPVTAHGVIYLSTTPQPGTPGNSVIYGHNWPNLLGKLSQAKIGQHIIVHTLNGDNKRFVISNITRVDPNDVSILQNTSDTRLTLYTCVGFLDSQRLVITAKSDPV